MSESTNDRQTVYHHDTDEELIDINGDSQLEDPRSYYGTRNNRLMYYEVLDITAPETPLLTERVEYYYGHDAPPAEASNGTEAGSPTLIVRKLIDPQTHLPTAYHGTSLAYNHQGEVGMMIERTWSESAGGGPDCESHTLGRGLELLGNGRTRYGVRQREFVADPGGWWYWRVVDGTTLWSDYDGEEVYGDYTVSVVEDPPGTWTPQLSERTAYLPGVGQMDSQTGAVTYHHADHLGTLRAVSDQQSAISGVMISTAFGEAVCGESEENPCGAGVPPVGTRYQYAGEWGYESGLGSPGNGGAAGQPALPWQHVGHRWYDPSTGRFLQRDPIGIHGGANLYAYVRNCPVVLVDPSGIIPIEPVDTWPPRTEPYPPGERKVRQRIGAIGLGICAAILLPPLVHAILPGDDDGEPKPPGWTEDWERRGNSRNRPDQAGKDWWDPEGGEWHWHPADEHHPDDHWDYRPWDDWNKPNKQRIPPLPL